MAYLEVEHGKRVYYEHHVGSARPVVLIHGWGMTAHCWDTTLSALVTAGHAVVTLDHRACGRSDKDFVDTSIAAIASDVVALVEYLELSRPVLNGWSLGGAVAVEAAARLGDQLAGLVLTAPAAPRFTATDGWPYGGTPADTEGILAGLAMDRASTVRAIAEALCAKPVGQNTVDWLWGQFLESGPRADTTLSELIELDYRNLIGTLSCPVLVAAGREDGFVSFDGIAASIPLFRSARLVEFPGCGHVPFLEDGETYRKELLSFVSGLAD
jgi:pimeloyl-[acyl-carrier protein] methyl ester esterase